MDSLSIRVYHHVEFQSHLSHFYESALERELLLALPAPRRESRLKSAAGNSFYHDGVCKEKRISVGLPSCNTQLRGDLAVSPLKPCLDRVRLCGAEDVHLL